VTVDAAAVENVVVVVEVVVAGVAAGS